MPNPTPIPIVLAVAPPKGDRFRWLVEKATELGVTRLEPLLSRRTVVDPREGKLDKLRQTVIAACKQCGRARLMEISEPIGFMEYIANHFSSPQAGVANVLLHPTGPPLLDILAVPAERLTLLVGPEGGFTDQEVEQAQAAGAYVASLGRTILRTETAAIAAAAVAVSLTAKGRETTSLI